MRRLADKVGRERLLLTATPELALRIVDHVRDHGRITISDAVTLTGANRNTLKEHLRMLVVRQNLVQHGVGRGTWYCLP